MREKEEKGKNGKGIEQQNSTKCFVAQLNQLLKGGGEIHLNVKHPNSPPPNSKLHTSSHFMTSSKFLKPYVCSSRWDDHYLISKLQYVLVPLQTINQLQSSCMCSSCFTTIINHSPISSFKDAHMTRVSPITVRNAAVFHIPTETDQTPVKSPANHQKYRQQRPIH